MTALQAATPDAAQLSLIVVYDDLPEGLTGRLAMLLRGQDARCQAGHAGPAPQVVGTTDWAKALHAIETHDGVSMLLSDLVSDTAPYADTPGARLLRRVAQSPQLAGRVIRVANSKFLSDSMLEQIRPWVHAAVEHPGDFTEVTGGTDLLVDLLDYVQNLAAEGVPSRAQTTMRCFPAEGTRDEDAVTQDIVLRVAKMRRASISPLDAIYVFGIFRGDPYPKILERVEAAYDALAPEQREKLSRIAIKKNKVMTVDEFMRNTSKAQVRSLAHLANDGLGATLTPEMLKAAATAKESIIRTADVPRRSCLTQAELELAEEILYAYKLRVDETTAQTGTPPTAPARRDLIDDALLSDGVQDAYRQMALEAYNDGEADIQSFGARFDLSHVLMCLAEATDRR